MKKWICMLLGICLLLSGCGASSTEETNEEQSETLKVVATVFPAYVLPGQPQADKAEVSLLLPPGAESHSYEPTPAGILAVQECDLFLYLGGESDAWVETILSAVEPKGQTLRMIDCVELLEEETVEGMEELPGHEDHGEGEVREMDEHVWTSPRMRRHYPGPSRRKWRSWTRTMLSCIPKGRKRMRSRLKSWIRNLRTSLPDVKTRPLSLGIGSPCATLPRSSA